VIVELRAVPDCPNLNATRDLLHACLAEAGLPLTVIERIGEYPSPSVLIDGEDVTGADPHAPAACVLRPPTAEQIRAALRAAITGTGEAGRDVTGAGSVVAECCQPGGAIRTDRQLRAAALPAQVRAVHRQVLRHFAATGTAPTPTDLVEVATRSGVDPVAALRRLAEDDFVAVDHAGRLVAAYPFSPTPTDHVVQLDGVRVYAMCAIDALGIPAMLGRDATITSADPRTRQSVTVAVTGGVAVFDPAETVVVYAATGSGGRSVDTCCSTINFFTGTASALAWIGAHPGLRATVLDQDSAVMLGRDIFGPLLSDPNPAKEWR